MVFFFLYTIPSHSGLTPRSRVCRVFRIAAIAGHQIYLRGSVSCGAVEASCPGSNGFQNRDSGWQRLEAQVNVMSLFGYKQAILALGIWLPEKLNDLECSITVAPLLNLHCRYRGGS